MQSLPSLGIVFVALAVVFLGIAFRRKALYIAELSIT